MIEGLPPRDIVFPGKAHDKTGGSLATPARPYSDSV